jgi:uncharacterized protein (DUF1684 family)
MSHVIGADEAVELLDWKRRVFSLYARVRAAEEPEHAWKEWRLERDELFRRHPQSPVPAPDRAAWSGLHYFPYDPELRTCATAQQRNAEHFEIPTSGDETMAFTRFATVAFELRGQRLTLELYWLEGYGGGLFLPFRDATSGRKTYGAGRYLLDTIKGADLGMEGDRLLLDFNFAYNPSCAYDPRWVCPLAPPANRLDADIQAGERTP